MKKRRWNLLFLGLSAAQNAKCHASWSRHVLLCPKQVLLLKLSIFKSFWGTFDPKFYSHSVKKLVVLTFYSNCGYLGGPNDKIIYTDIAWHMPHNIFLWLSLFWLLFWLLHLVFCPFRQKKVVVFGFFGQLWQHGMTKWHGNWYRYVLLYCKQVLSWIWFILRSFWGTYGPKYGNLDRKMCRIWWFLLYCGHICGQNDLKFGRDIVWHMPHKFY